jgi:hypothetical protein
VAAVKTRPFPDDFLREWSPLKSFTLSVAISAVPEPTENCRFEIYGFSRFLRMFSSEMSVRVSSFFLLPMKAQCVQGPTDLIRIRFDKLQADAGSMIR